MTIVKMEAVRQVAQVGPAQSQPALLLGMGTANPELQLSQLDIEQRMAEVWNLSGTALARWRRIIAGSEIQKRHGVLPPQAVVRLGTAERMRAYERFAPELAASAARQAMADARVEASSITDLVVVSCTGFSAPGVDLGLIESLGLRHDVRRTLVGFMGCFGAISGLRTAVGACACNRDATVLMVCVELCSLHMRADDSPQNQVASALFSDGAAAAVLRSGLRNGSPRNHAAGDAIGYVNAGASLVIPEGREWMSWRITDAGFAMTLTRDVPLALIEHLSAFVQRCGSANKTSNYAIHPGGPGILDAADQALELCGAHGIDISRRVLREFGNMSSATVLFVLRDMISAGYPLPILLLAFGPGLTIESIQLTGKA